MKAAIITSVLKHFDFCLAMLMIFVAAAIVYASYYVTLQLINIF